MILLMSGIITVAAALQWIIIRRIPYRLARIFVQIPLLIATFFIAWFVAFAVTGGEDAQATSQQAATQQILDLATVTEQDLTLTISATGSLAPARQAPLAFQLAGLAVSEVLVETGQRVDTGDLLARLDMSSLQQTLNNAQIAFNLQQAAFDALTTPPREADIAAAEAALQAAQASVGSAVATAPSQFQEEIARLQSEIARNQLWQAQIQRDAVLPPEPIPGVGDIDLPDDVPDDVDEAVDNVTDDINSIIQGLNAEASEAARDALIQAQAAVDGLEFAVDIADVSYDSLLGRGADTGALAGANAERIQAEIALERLINGPTELELAQAALDLELAELALEQAQISSAETELFAPFSGIIAQNNLTEQEFPPQGIAMILLDDSSFYVDLPIDEADVVLVRVGQRVEFVVDALPDATVTGTVSSIAYTPLPVEGLVAYNTRVEIESNGAALRAGMTVTGNIVTEERPSVLVIPNNFIRFNRLTGDAFVNVRDELGVVEERLILLGAANDAVSEVLAGLEVGEELVLLPSQDDSGGGGLFGG